jgi:hypothetical protein
MKIDSVNLSESNYKSLHPEVKIQLSRNYCESVKYLAD